MRIPLPTSRGSFRWGLSVLDMGWAAAVPLVALVIRDAPILYYSNFDLGRFWLISFAACLVAFAAFRLHQQLPRYFGIKDALAIAKATVFAEFIIFFAMFFMTRLDGVPRSTLVIHALLISGGLILSRLLIRLIRTDSTIQSEAGAADAEHIVLIGANGISAAFVRLLDSIAPGKRHVVAVLDDSPRLKGRSMAGIAVAGSIGHLASLIDEFKVHGVRIDRVLVAGSQESLPALTMEAVRSICADEELALDFLPDLFGMGSRQEPAMSKPSPEAVPNFAPSTYFRFKRGVDIVLAASMMLLFAPVFLTVVILAYLDVGAPVVFWQRRLGCKGQPFRLRKIRTLRAPYDARGRALPNEERLSAFGRFLRRSHLDELPQLLNVLVGDMSLIGPRPLLPRDQPEDPTVRLMVRPGISGWAQVNGGALLTAAEKDVFDEWYVRNATLQVDLRIMRMSLSAAFTGDVRFKQRPSHEMSIPKGQKLALSASAADTRDLRHRKSLRRNHVRGESLSGAPSSHRSGHGNSQLRH
jgi:lipopolysaccharide/colanic/teichoic acid biosynthesis glycosyltransferase